MIVLKKKPQSTANKIKYIFLNDVFKKINEPRHKFKSYKIDSVKSWVKAS